MQLGGLGERCKLPQRPQRMDVDDFEELFRLVEPAIKKKTAKFR